MNNDNLHYKEKTIDISSQMARNKIATVARFVAEEDDILFVQVVERLNQLLRESAVKDILLLDDFLKILRHGYEVKLSNPKKK